MVSNNCMIVAKGKPITADVLSCCFDEASRKWSVTFCNGRTFYYSEQNVALLQDSVSLEAEKYEIWKDGNQLIRITSIEVFKNYETEYWRICFKNGSMREYCRDELQVFDSILADETGRRVFDYLKDVAKYISIRTEDDTAILSKQYEKIDAFSDKTTAAVYLNPEKYHPETGINNPVVIFPFGCNESQFEAVNNALKSRLSVIEGPPGTGKTQTILNIIANLVIDNRKVQVVSNNNSAIRNIVEKMASDKYKIDFIAALLGREENKTKFIENQTGCYPDISEWVLDEKELLNCQMQILKITDELREVFRRKQKLAELKQEKYDVRLEQIHSQGQFPTEQPHPDLFTKKVSSDRVLSFWQEYEDIKAGGRRAGLLYRIIRRLSYGIRVGYILKANPNEVLRALQALYYSVRLEEIDSSIELEIRFLENVSAEELIDELTRQSLKFFRAKLAERYNITGKRHVFTRDAFWRTTDEFLKEYPVILSTTFTARSSLGQQAVFDYVIMDEASQVDVATGFLALSSAINAVVVGDIKQLPNVVTSIQKKNLHEMFIRYSVPEAYSFADHSFLDSICCVMGDRIRKVILKEHYRCHPQIIGFCNQRFYQNELIIMTAGNETDVLMYKKTVQGHHARGHINQRQADVIIHEILPRLSVNPKDIGIIAPYRDQVELLRKNVVSPEIDIDTVHKFQGREKDVIILSTVDDIVTSFSDDPHLLNVAISRARKKLILVAADDIQPQGSITGDLIKYIKYNNGDIQPSNVCSVFDYLYKQNEVQRLEYLKKYKRVSEYDSENLMYALIKEELKKRSDESLAVVCHIPLNLLLKDDSGKKDVPELNAEEHRFINTGLSHLDFLIYDRFSREPILAVEVDGFNFHKEGTKQAERDQIKNQILNKYDIPLLRFPTNGSGEKERLAEKLDSLHASPDQNRQCET